MPSLTNCWSRYPALRTTLATQIKRWRSQETPAKIEVGPRLESKSKPPAKQSALYAPTGDIEGGKSVIFAVQPYVDLQWLLHDSEENFTANLRRRGYDPSKYPARTGILNDAKLLSRLHTERGEIKQQQQHVANEMAKLKQTFIEEQRSTDAADQKTRNFAQTMREEGLRLRNIAKDQAAQISVLERRVILPALSLPNRLDEQYTDYANNADVRDVKVSANNYPNVEMRNTSPSPYMRGLSAEAELWLLNTIINELIGRRSFIPLSPPSFYQAVVAEGCTATDPIKLVAEPDDETVSESSSSSAYAVLFPPTMEHGYKVHETRATYLLCHPCMPMAAFLANAEIPTVSLPAKLAWAARMHLSTPLSRQYKNFIFSQPNVVGWTILFPSSSTTVDRDKAFQEIKQTVRDLVKQAVDKIQGRNIDADLHWTTAPPDELFNDEMLRHCLELDTIQQHGSRLELARCSLGGTFISKRLKILHAPEKHDKKSGGGHVKRNFPADYGFLECIHGIVNLSHVAALCSSAS